MKTIRERLGLTQAELAERLGVTQSSISRFERGELQIDRRTALAMESLLQEQKAA